LAEVEASAMALLVQALFVDFPAPGDSGHYTGPPTVGVLGVAVLAIGLNGFGEETGWRGFVVSTLRPRFGRLGTALAIAPVRPLWHLPYFFLLQRYQSFNAFTIIGFLIGRTATSPGPATTLTPQSCGPR
jgi:uncharacterized protein